LVAAMSGHDSDRAPSDYVQRLFDEYADKFDSHLAKTLNYQTPSKLADLLHPHVQLEGKLRVLDLGCGTGLFGTAIAAFAQQIVGVDLSPKMLEKARALNLYHRLVQSDLLAMMQEETAESFDVVSAADVFVYIGKLDELVVQTRRLLSSNGLFAFSVESLEALSSVPGNKPLDYQLLNSARYAHSIAYLNRLASLNGFQALHITETQIRLDKGQPIQGYLAVWRRLPQGSPNGA